MVIVDAYGYPTIAADAATYSQAEGLPAFTSTSFQIYSPIPVTTVDSGCAEETTLDVEAAHAVAPCANISLVTAGFFAVKLSCTCS